MKKLNSNDYIVLNNILLNDEVSRGSLAESINVTHPAILKLIKKLQSLNLVIETNIANTRGGRPKKQIELNREYKYIVGVYLENDSVTLCVTYLDGTVLESRKRKVSQIVSKNKIIKIMIEELGIIVDKYTADRIVGIGLAIPGTYNHNNGVIKLDDLPVNENFNIKDYIEKTFNLPCLVENNKKSILHAEKLRGILKYKKDAIYLYFNKEISVSILMNDKIHYGSNYQSGKFGNFIDENGVELGKYCSFKQIIERTGIEYNQDIKLDEFFELVSKKTEPHYSIINELGKIIAIKLSNIIKLLDIESICLAGPYLKKDDILTNAIKDNLRNYLDLSLYPNIEILYSNLGPDYDVFGASSLILANLFDNNKLLKINS